MTRTIQTDLNIDLFPRIQQETPWNLYDDAPHCSLDQFLDTLENADQFAHTWDDLPT